MPLVLPPMRTLNQFGGDWPRYCDTLYAEYVRDVVNVRREFLGVQINCRRVPVARGKASGFWHCIQSGPIEDDREPDLRRCERLSWLPCVLDNVCVEPEILWWRNKRGTDINVPMYVADERYLVILGERNGYNVLITTYYIDRDKRHEALLREHEEYWTAQNG